MIQCNKQNWSIRLCYGIDCFIFTFTFHQGTSTERSRVQKLARNSKCLLLLSLYCNAMVMQGITKLRVLGRLGVLTKTNGGLQSIQSGLNLFQKYRVFPLTWPASLQIYWDKRKRLHKKKVQLPQDWSGTPTWPPFHCFGTPIWPPWRHVKTLYCCLS